MTATPMPANEKCPKCGATGAPESCPSVPEVVHYPCGTSAIRIRCEEHVLHISRKCLLNERDVAVMRAESALRAAVARLEGELAEAKRFDDPEMDGTDGAHPAFWRGQDDGVRGVVSALNGILDKKEHVGTFWSQGLEALARRIAALESRLASADLIPKAVALRACELGLALGSFRCVASRKDGNLPPTEAVKQSTRNLDASDAHIRKHVAEDRDACMAAALAEAAPPPSTSTAEGSAP